MKKRLVILVLMMVMICSTGFFTSAEDGDDAENFVKVGLRSESSETIAEITSVSGLALCSIENEQIKKTDDRSLETYGDIFLVLENGRINVKDHSDNVIAQLTGDGSECIVSDHYFTDNDYICLDGTAYRGGIIPYINDAGQLNIINCVELEDYVKGVLNREMKYTSSLEALKAQAVSARSFAIVNKGKYGDQGFDVSPDTNCQCYSGVAGEYPSIVNAVQATKGEILYYNGEPVEGIYCANSGGYTENSEDVWSSEQGYLRSIRDKYSPELNWSTTYTRKELTKLLADKDVGNVNAITIDSFTETGAIASMTYYGDQGSFSVSNDTVRSLLNLRSRRFIIRLDDAADDGEIDESNDISTIRLDSDDDVIVIAGSGFGHCAGMSQQGAQNMAKLGFSYIDILTYYYTDIEVR